MCGKKIVEAGTPKLVRANKGTIFIQGEALLNTKMNIIAKAVIPYGDGKDSEIIYNYISNIFHN